MLSEQRLRELEVALDDLGRTTGGAEDFRQLIAAARVANALEQWWRTDTLPAWRAIEAAHRIYTAHGPAEVAR